MPDVRKSSSCLSERPGEPEELPVVEGFCERVERSGDVNAAHEPGANISQKAAAASQQARAFFVRLVAPFRAPAL
jgi:hypothetical protein